jgi:hypothetical protein
VCVCVCVCVLKLFQCFGTNCGLHLQDECESEGGNGPVYSFRGESERGVKRLDVEPERTTWLERSVGGKETKPNFTQFFFVSVFTVKVWGGGGVVCWVP